MDVRIGIVQGAPVALEMPEGTDRAALAAEIAKKLEDDDEVLSLTDRKGRTVIVNSGRIAYVEIGSGEADRRIGFGA